jgi:hypothetical protein
MLNIVTKYKLSINVVRFHVITAAIIKMRVFWDIAPCSLDDLDRRFRQFIVLMMQVVRISETSVCFNETTRRYIPENCHLIYIFCLEFVLDDNITNMEIILNITAIM